MGYGFPARTGMGLDVNVIGQCTQVSARSAEDCGAAQCSPLSCLQVLWRPQRRPPCYSIQHALQHPVSRFRSAPAHGPRPARGRVPFSPCVGWLLSFRVIHACFCHRSWCAPLRPRRERRGSEISVSNVNTVNHYFPLQIHKFERSIYAAPWRASVLGFTREGSGPPTLPLPVLCC